MGNYAILRTGKIKSFSKLKQAGAHNSRQAPVPNAKPNGKHYLLAGSEDPCGRLEALLERTGITPRKNAVLAGEIFLSYSPDASVPVGKWKDACMDFINKELPKGSVLSAELHMDETTPHIHVLFAPLIKKEVRGKVQWSLSCRDYFGGKDKLSGLQDRYYEAVKGFGLDRGIKGSKAKHKEIKKFYGELENKIEEIVKEYQEIKSNMPDSPGIFNIKPVWNGINKIIDKIDTLMIEAKRAKELERRLKAENKKRLAAEKKLAEINEVVSGISDERLLIITQEERARQQQEAERRYSNPEPSQAQRAADEAPEKPSEPSRARRKGKDPSMDF